MKATPDQVRALFAGEMQPQTAEDAIGLMRATDAATRPLPSWTSTRWTTTWQADAERS